MRRPGFRARVRKPSKRKARDPDRRRVGDKGEGLDC